MPNLSNLRQQINVIDDELISLLEKRVEVARKIGHYKKQNNLPIYDEAREKEVIESKKKLSKLPEKNIEAIFSEIIRMCREVQNPIR